MAGIPDEDFYQTAGLLASDIECHDMWDEMRNFDTIRINSSDTIQDAAFLAMKLAFAIEFETLLRHHSDRPMFLSKSNEGPY